MIVVGSYTKMNVRAVIALDLGGQLRKYRSISMYYYGYGVG